MNYQKFFKWLLRITRLAVVLLPLALLFWLVNLDLVRSGEVTFVYDVGRDSATITRLFPENRLSSFSTAVNGRDNYQQVLSEPVYFEVRSPQTFETAEVTVTYRNQQLPLLQLGLRTNGEQEWNYDFLALENQLLDDLDWHKIESEQGSLWQREKKFLSFEQFLYQSPNLSDIAAYQFSLAKNFVLPNYQPAAGPTVLNRSLRGSHSFYTYLKNEPLNFQFTIQDVNRTDGPDFLTIKVYDTNNVKIHEQTVADDGLVSKNDLASKPRQVSLILNDLAEGVYRVVLDCEDEIFIRRIVTSQKYLTFIDRIYLGDVVEYQDNADLPLAVYSTVPRLGFYTSHQEGLQDLGINEQSLKIAETHKNYFFTPAKIPSFIYLPKNDLKIFGRGLLALSESMYFNPEIYDLRDLTNFSGVNYLVSSYKTPKEELGWKVGRAKFDLANANLTNRKLRFALSAPELNDRQLKLDLKSIKVKLTKAPLSSKEFWAKVKSYLKNKF